ncbi:MAG: hypothetical protein PVJ89_04175 [Planctomycetota bacterium]|jgi:hypothetical protein
MMRRPELALAAALAAASVLVTVLVYGPVSGGALLGFDGYPLIAASTLDAPGDLLGTFGQELMGGRYPDGRFYRPLVHLTFALDHALGGLDPAQYARTDLALAALTATLLGLLAAAMTGARGRSAAAAAALTAAIYLAHPAQLEVIPYAPRRADALALLFVTAAALAVIRGARPWWTALLALCAVLSKESGVIVVPVTFAAALCRPDLASAARALRATAGPFAGVALGLVLRTAVLGGLGGHAESGAPGAESLASIASSLWSAAAGGAPWARVPLALLLAGGLWVVGAPSSAHGRARALLPLLWAGGVVVLTSVSGRFHDWYALGLVAPMALVGGVAVGGLNAGGIAAGARSRAVSLAAGLALAALAVLWHLGSPQRATLAVAQSISADQARRFVALLEGAPPGEAAVFEPWVFAVATELGAPPIFVHAPYSLSALGELTLGPAAVTVTQDAAAAPPAPGTVHVRLVPGPPPPSSVAPR